MKCVLLIKVERMVRTFLCDREMWDHRVNRARPVILDRLAKPALEARRVTADVAVLKGTVVNLALLDAKEKWEKREKPEKEAFKDQLDLKANRSLNDF